LSYILVTIIMQVTFGSQNETAGRKARPDAEARVFWVGSAEISTGVRAALASAAVV